MYKILFHVGFPKTATTSLQDNLLYELHKQGKINFLGRGGWVTPDTSHDPMQDVLNIALKSKTKAKEKFQKLLRKDILNVISNEGCCGIFGHCGATWLKHSENLLDLLSPYDYETLVSLRAPLDFFYSLYIQDYGTVFVSKAKMNTLKKFQQTFFKNPKDTEYRMFYSFEALKFIVDFYKVTPSKLHILLYEDLKHDKNTYFEQLAHLLEEDQQIVESLFMKKMQNVKTKTSSGYISDPVMLGTSISAIEAKIFKTQCGFLLKKLLRPILKYPWKMLLKISNNFIAIKGVEHPPLTDKEKEKLKPVLLKDNEKLHTEFGVDLEKLKKYGYLLEKQ